MRTVQDKVAVVTGAASGIGWAIARGLAEAGARVVLADVDADALATRTSELRSAGFDVTSQVCDVSSRSDVRALRGRTLETFGACHVLCNNAGVSVGGSIATLTGDDWSRSIGVNLWGVIHGVEAFLPDLIGQDEGHIVNTASVGGLFASPFAGPYNVAKFGVVALSESLLAELELAKSSVGVSLLCPGWVATNIARTAQAPNPVGDDPRTARAQRAMVRLLEHRVSHGVDPADVAGAVLGAIVANQFYVFTDDRWRRPVHQRMDALLEGRRPPTLLPD